MGGRIEKRLIDLGIRLPEPPVPAASYVPCVISGAHAHVAGQVPLGPDGLLHKGAVGAELSLDEGIECARLCAINILAQARTALDGDLDRIVRIVKLGGFVAIAPDFDDQHLVINGASDLMADVFGEAGQHARIAVGVPSLPLGAPVEIDALIEIAGR